MSYINKLIKKYKKIVMYMPLMDDEDAIKVEMAAEFQTELQQLKKIFKSGE